MQYVKWESPPKIGNYIFQTLSLFLSYLEQYGVYLLPQGKKRKKKQTTPPQNPNTNQPLFYVVMKFTICQGWVNTVRSRAGNH